MERRRAWPGIALIGILSLGALALPVSRAGDATTTPRSTGAGQPASAASTAPAWPDNAPTPEQVMYDQPALMRRALSQLTPQTPGKVDLYLIAFAGDGEQNVFHNEAEYAARLFATRFRAAGHVLVLENNPATLSTHPLATWSNLETALAALHRLMNPHEDILMLYFTSHGSPDHTLIVNMPPLPLDMIGAQDMAGILREQPFAWKVVVVNACYSGGFVKPLAGPGTLVMTAASSDRSSFGCGAESRITYFGDALLTHALNHTDNLIDAFSRARQRVATWERWDQLPASDPQISVGRGIAAQLARWRRSLHPGPAVAFGAKAGAHETNH